MKQHRCKKMIRSPVHLAKHDTEKKGIDSLRKVHMVKTEQCRTDQCGRPETRIVFHPAKDQSPKDQFFRDRSKDHRTDDHKNDSRRKDLRFHSFIAVKDPIDIKQGNQEVQSVGKRRA